MIEIHTEMDRSWIQPIEVQIDYFTAISIPISNTATTAWEYRGTGPHTRKNELETGTRNDSSGTYDEW